MIIVEGPDGAGKSTLINHLYTTFKLDVIHTPGPMPDLYLWLLEQGLERTRNEKPPKIYDRFFISETIYGPILRDQVGYPPFFTDFFLRYVLQPIHPLVILCLPTLAIVKDSVMNQPQMAGVIDNIDAIYNAYLDALPLWKRIFGDDFITYDWTLPAGPQDVDTMVRDLVTFGRRTK